MSDIAIRVENLSKLYHIGKAQERHDTIRDALTAGLRAPLERLRRNRESGSGDQGAGNRESEDTIWASKDVSFEVQRGEVVGAPALWCRRSFASLRTGIGRNGAGKSTCTLTRSVPGSRF